MGVASKVRTNPRTTFYNAILICELLTRKGDANEISLQLFHIAILKWE